MLKKQKTTDEMQKHLIRRKQAFKSHILGLPLAGQRLRGAPKDQPYPAITPKPLPLFIPTATPSTGVTPNSGVGGGCTEALGFAPEFTAIKAEIPTNSSAPVESHLQPTQPKATGQEEVSKL